MRFVLLFVLLVLLVPVVAVGGPVNLDSIFEGCTFFQPVAHATVGTDTLWFTKASPGQGTASWAAQSADYYAPTAVPIGSSNDGDILLRKRPVQKLLLYSRVPFIYRGFANGVASDAVYTSIDTISLVGGAPHSGEYPCWTVFSYPDSIYITDSGADTVRVHVGY